MLIYPYGLPSQQRDEDRPQSKWTQFLHHFTVYHVSAEQPKVQQTTAPINPINKTECPQLIPHPTFDEIPKYEPINLEEKMEWKRLVPHANRPPFWFHYEFQMPDIDEPSVKDAMFVVASKASGT
eukprot:CAMPEP_0197021016 /NCGR_PEP_ID=MMETSP1384-20130603/1897_1 /TAXON_ID=29189 /ORGANISM="Ammonia sp." /LENGTH=124 /DNA_ID=CAMNT_0042448757 /DNA_START=44 /DNA_END=419 /DNA_ORIENTATION=+